jgi:hypothetical protein
LKHQTKIIQLYISRNKGDKDMTQETIRDEFVSEEFIDKNAALPTVIVLNDQHHCGYFIPVGTMAKSGWIDFDESQLISHTFRSGETELGVLMTQPRMLICPKTDLYQYDVKASEEQRTRAIVGFYDPALKDDPNIKTERLYLVFFLDADNKPLHTSPLKYAARGVNGATFEKERQAFKMELEASHAIINQIPAKPKNELFHSLGVFCFTTKPELVGDRQKAWCCRVVEHEKPTTENWTNYFVGYREELKRYAWEALEPGQKIDVLSVRAIESSEEMVSLPPGSSEVIDRADEAQTHASLFPAESLIATSSLTVGHASDSNLKGASHNPDIPF